MSKLTDKQLKFCNEYLIDLNATQAAIRSGYSKKTAMEQASRLLSNVKVYSYISDLQNKRQKRTEITSDLVIKELAKIALFDIRKIYDQNGMLISPTQLDDDTAGAIASIKSRIEKQSGEPDDWAEIKEYKLADKIRALELLGRHLGIFDKKDGSQNDTSQTTTQINIIKDA